MTTTETTVAITEEQALTLRAIVLEVLELEDDELTDTSRFIEDHEADSLLAIEILARIESDLGVVIPQDQLIEMTHLAAVRTVVARNAGGALHD